MVYNLHLLESGYCGNVINNERAYNWAAVTKFQSLEERHDRDATRRTESVTSLHCIK